MAIFPRLSARRGQTVELCTTFYRGGQAFDPYAIRKVDIYRNSVLPHNLVATIPIAEPCGGGTGGEYPAPLVRGTTTLPAGECGTAEQAGSIITGKYCLNWDVPADSVAPDVYFDVWTYFPDNPCLLVDFEDSVDCEEVTNGDPCHQDLDSVDLATLQLSCCHKFWVYPDAWFCDDQLSTVRLGFEPLDQKFQHNEVRPLEIGLMPLPLYDYDFNLVSPILPFLTATIKVETRQKELLVDGESMSIGLRQGSYRSNPYVLKWNLDTSRFLKGSYDYRVTVTLPDGSTRVSPDFVFSVQ